MSAAFLIANIGHTHKDHEHICWWRPEGRGYTICIDKAGRYDEAEAARICRSGCCIAVRFDSVAPLALSTPFYRLSNGRLATLYDGGPHLPVANSADNWKLLLSVRLSVAIAYRTQRPTPITRSKARAIYLDRLPEVAHAG